jgi:Kef-type K+ transport system membrane component KefB
LRWRREEVTVTHPARALARGRFGWSLRPGAATLDAVQRITRRGASVVVLLASVAALLLPRALRAAVPDAGAPGAPAAAERFDAGADAGPAFPAANRPPAADPSYTAPIVAPLPAVEPDPALAPVIEGRERQPPARPVAPEERPGVVIRTIIGLLTLMVLAYLGGHPRVLSWEKRLGISQVITTGFPFVICGVLARSNSVGILSDAVLAEISPLLRLGLGWIGFVAGIRFDTRMFQGLPARTLRIVTLTTLFPFALLVGACAGLLFLFHDQALGLGDPVFLRDALILGTAGAMTAVTSTRAGSREGAGNVLARVIRLEELAGVIGLLFVAAFFRPQGASWQMPGTAWVLLTIGLGATAGVLIYAILQRRMERADFLVLTLGSISFAAGAASYLLLSSVVVAFIAGVLLANFPGSYHERLREMLFRLERPIYLLSLFIIGALWQVGDWRGWVLMPVFMSLRLAGKWLGTRLALVDAELPLGVEERRAIAMPPLGPLAIAIVTNALLLYPGGSISLVVSAVIGGGVLTEIFLQLGSRRRARLSLEPVSSG